MGEPKDLTTQKEAAITAGVTLATLHERIKRGQVVVYEKFGKRLVSLKQVLAYEPDKRGPKPKPKTQQNGSG